MTDAEVDNLFNKAKNNVKNAKNQKTKECWYDKLNDLRQERLKRVVYRSSIREIGIRKFYNL